MNISENGGLEAPLFKIGATSHFEPYERDGRWQLEEREGPWEVRSMQDINLLIQGFVNGAMDRFFELKVKNQKGFIEFRRRFDQQITDALNTFEVYIPSEKRDFFKELDHDRNYFARCAEVVSDFAVRLLCNVRLVSNIRDELCLCEEGEMKSALVEAFQICDDSKKNPLFDYKRKDQFRLDPRWDKESKWLRAIEQSFKGCTFFTTEDRENVLRMINDWLASDDAADCVKLRSDLKKVLKDSGAFYFRDAEKYFDTLFDGWWATMQILAKEALISPMSLYSSDVQDGAIAWSVG